MSTKTDHNTGVAQSEPTDKPESNSHVVGLSSKFNWKVEDIKFPLSGSKELSAAEFGAFSLLLRDRDNFDDSHSSTSDEGMGVRVFRQIRELYRKYRYTTLVIDLIDAGGNIALKDQGKRRSWTTFVEQSKQVLVDELNKRASADHVQSRYASAIPKLPPFDAHDITAEWVLRMVSVGKTDWEDTEKANSRPPFSYVKWKHSMRSVDIWADVDAEPGNQSQSHLESNMHIMNRLQQELVDRNERVNRLEKLLADRNKKVNRLKVKLAYIKKKQDGLERPSSSSRRKTRKPLKTRSSRCWHKICLEEYWELRRLHSGSVSQTRQQTARKKEASDDEDEPLSKRIRRA